VRNGSRSDRAIVPAEGPYRRAMFRNCHIETKRTVLPDPFFHGLSIPASPLPPSSGCRVDDAELEVDERLPSGMTKSRKKRG
jgi:hypothetical protein